MNKTLIVKFLASVLLLVLIVLGILFPATDVPFTIIFLIPIAYFSLQKNVSLIFIVSLSALTAIAWLITYLILNGQSLNLASISYAFIRFGIYFTISYFLVQLKRDYDKIT